MVAVIIADLPIPAEALPGPRQEQLLLVQVHALALAETPAQEALHLVLLSVVVVVQGLRVQAADRQVRQPEEAVRAQAAAGRQDLQAAAVHVQVAGLLALPAEEVVPVGLQAVVHQAAQEAVEETKKKVRKVNSGTDERIY